MKAIPVINGYGNRRIQAGVLRISNLKNVYSPKSKIAVEQVRTELAHEVSHLRMMYEARLSSLNSSHLYKLANELNAGVDCGIGKNTSVKDIGKTVDSRGGTDPISDICDLMSLKYGIHVTAHDNHKICGEVSLKVLTAPDMCDERNTFGIGEAVYIDGEKIICGMENKDVSELAGTSVHTTEALLILQGNSETSWRSICDCALEIETELRNFHFVTSNDGKLACSSTYRNDLFPDFNKELKRLNEQSQNTIDNEAKLWKEYGIQTSRHILDVGTGTGHAAAWFAELEHKPAVRAIDIDDLFLAVAEQNLSMYSNVTVAKGNVYTVGQEYANEFDFVCARWLVGHLKFPRSAIANMIACLRPGGVLALTYGDESLSRMKNGSQQHYESCVQKRIDMGCDVFFGKNLAQILASQGLVDITSKYIPFDDPLPSYINNNLRKYYGVEVDMDFNDDSVLMNGIWIACGKVP
eukprot:CAMPEP_0183789766 /NCGR_PEP_ID=MMETSP0803_2-20130417/625_1 /TAXON_ID=195967 /ORGANISM="Crustomastix stigmata, Strain CCMP3273" /LENGTH=466 /DNA_ID=CAMNT_0026033947 /DNA_START=115 /DNA_END=1515 /DNA_ORIENTATION=-